ncbi:MAG: DUF559 domain-containing protein, partial [Chloroflexi bacterium]|nr:DUF559 domain-containing protein [Chloroflexota bacterium]
MGTDRARVLRKNSTDAERRLWQHLRRYQINGCKFRRQQPIGPYIVDFVCFEKRLIIEVDGGQHMLQVEDDNTRTEWLRSQGFQVLRFWNNQVLGDVEAVKYMIRNNYEDEPGIKPGDIFCNNDAAIGDIHAADVAT